MVASQPRNKRSLALNLKSIEGIGIVKRLVEGTDVLITGTPGIPPARVGVSLYDSLASMHAAIGTLMSVLRVKTGQGEGQIVDVSLVERLQCDAWS